MLLAACHPAPAQKRPRADPNRQKKRTRNSNDTPAIKQLEARYKILLGALSQRGQKAPRVPSERPRRKQAPKDLKGAKELEKYRTSALEEYRAEALDWFSKRVEECEFILYPPQPEPATPGDTSDDDDSESGWRFA